MPARVAGLGLVVLVLAACSGPAERLAPEEPSHTSATLAPQDTPSPTPSPAPSCTPSDESTAPPVATPSSEPTAPPTEPDPEPAEPTAEPTAPATPTAPEEPDRLAVDDEGTAVREVQDRLVELGYWLGTPDGVFGDDTHHAVVALQKAAGISRDGIVGPATRTALDDGMRPRPRSTDGPVVEVDRARQLLVLVDDGQLRWTFDTSTGRQGLTTPAGTFQVTRSIDGYRHAPLGTLYRPLYFNGGIAIHGYPSVPPHPASHGCVRVTNAAMDWMWANDFPDVGTPVWVY